MAPSERQECGYYGITKEECLNKTCCWDDTVENTKWCFNQPGKLNLYFDIKDNEMSRLSVACSTGSPSSV